MMDPFAQPNNPWQTGNGWTGVILAGGRSSRMGRDKAMIEIDGRTLLDRALDILQPHVNDLLVVGDPENMATLDRSFSRTMCRALVHWGVFPPRCIMRCMIV